MQKFLLKFLVSLITTNAFAACVITGCNNEVCALFDHDQVVGICQFKPEYKCYHQFGICEEDGKGGCSWRNTTELQQCLQNIQQVIEGLPQSVQPSLKPMKQQETHPAPTQQTTTEPTTQTTTTTTTQP